MKTLAGCYDNIEQSQGNPKDFAAYIYFRPLPWEVFNGIGFYSEQIYEYAPWEPYDKEYTVLKFQMKSLLLKTTDLTMLSNCRSRQKSRSAQTSKQKYSYSKVWMFKHFRENLPVIILAKLSQVKNV